MKACVNLRNKMLMLLLLYVSFVGISDFGDRVLQIIKTSRFVLHKKKILHSFFENINRNLAMIKMGPNTAPHILFFTESGWKRLSDGVVPWRSKREVYALLWT